MGTETTAELQEEFGTVFQQVENLLPVLCIDMAGLAAVLNLSEVYRPRSNIKCCFCNCTKHEISNFTIPRWQPRDTESSCTEAWRSAWPSTAPPTHRAGDPRSDAHGGGDHEEAGEPTCPRSDPPERPVEDVGTHPSSTGGRTLTQHARRVSPSSATEPSSWRCCRSSQQAKRAGTRPSLPSGNTSLSLQV